MQAEKVSTATVHWSKKTTEGAYLTMLECTVCKLKRAVSLLFLQCIVTITLFLCGCQGIEDAVSSALVDTPNGSWVKASNCSELRWALEDPIVQTVILHGTVQCVPSQEWIDIIELDRDVQIIGSTSTSSLEWGSSLEMVSLAPLRKLLLANLVLLVPTLEDVSSTKLAGFQEASAVLMSGVTIGVKECSQSTKDVTDTLKRITRPKIFEGDQEVLAQADGTAEIVSHGQEFGSGFVYKCKSLVFCRWTPHDAQGSLEGSGLSTDCGETFGIKFGVPMFRKWINTLNLGELVGVAVAVGALLAATCIICFVRLQKKKALEAPKAEVSGAFCTLVVSTRCCKSNFKVLLGFWNNCVVF